jgi:hypothetical protein
MFNGEIHYEWSFSIAILTYPEGNQLETLGIKLRHVKPTEFHLPGEKSV